MFFETEARPAALGPQRTLWAVGGALVLLAGLGVGFLAALRAGPSSAVAVNAPAATRKRVPPAPGLLVPPAPAGRRVGSGAQAVAPATKPPRAAGASPSPGVSLPGERELDLQLKALWQAGENAGLSTRTIRTARAIRLPEYGIQPVRCEFTGSFPQTVRFLHNLRSSLPAAVVESIEITPDGAPANGSLPVQTAMNVNWYFSPLSAGGAGAAAPLCPMPDIAGVLAETAALSKSRFQFTRVVVKVDGAAAVPGTPLRASVTLEASASSDMDVAEWMSDLSRCGRLADLNLTRTEHAETAGKAVRAFTLEFNVRPEGERRGAGGAAGPVHVADAPDVFRAPAWLPPAPSAKSPGKAMPVQATDPAAAAAQRLQLESIVSGKSPACVINGRLYRVGNPVNGLTIEKIEAGGIVLRSGAKRLEVKLKKP